MQKLLQDVERIESLNSFARVARLSDSILKEIESKLIDLQKRMITLLKLRQRVIKKVHEVASSIERPLERRITYSILGSSEAVDVESLSEEFGVREREVKEALSSLEKRLDIRFQKI